ncbi:protein MAINTENANCE OF MERISTEMS-like [Glycine soja]|uniref:protein MAINTENANCE OF MERISTEMS-like n=1 Tax=Glycine soja TaxID=3848 RepID=UPI001040C78F|nr:protein MAINTENANCE OF MERISTEMS-like [Glycine soja]
MVDVDAQDIGPETNAQDIGAQDVADEPEGFLGGPRDRSVLTEYADHVTASVCTSIQEHPELKLSSHGRKVHNLGRPIPTIKDMVAGTGLSALIACSIDTDDQGLISSFVERWHRETSSFHFQPLHTNEVVLLLVELLMVSAEVAMAEIGQCGGPYVCLQWLRDVYQHRCQTQHWIATARAYVLHLLGCTLFANKSATHVHVVHLQALRDLTLARQYAWGAIGLIHMYDQLNDASLSTSRQLAGYITLLQIYEHFSSVAECNADSDYDAVSPHACRWIATKKIVKKLRWGPAVVRYISERVMRQFGYVQCIPAHPVHSWVSYDDMDDTWTHYSNHLATAGDLCVVSGQCAPDYIDWFFIISHPFMTTPQTDPPRDAYATQPSHIPHEAAPTSTHADPDADEPRHAVIKLICGKLANQVDPCNTCGSSRSVEDSRINLIRVWSTILTRINLIRKGLT